MRPQRLNPLFAAASSLPGIGAKLERTLGKLFGRDGAGARVVDLLFHAPNGLIDRSFRPSLDQLPEHGIVTLEVEIGRHRPPPPHNKRVPYKIDCFDDTGSLSLIFFHAHTAYLLKTLPPGERRFISGSIEWFNGLPQISHPDHILSAQEFAAMPAVEPVYPLTAGLSAKVLAKAVQASLDLIPDLDEWQDPAWLEKNCWPEFAASLGTLHHPLAFSDLEPDAPARARLAYDELLANQLALALVRRRMKRASGRALRGSGQVSQKILSALPYSLTASQRLATDEIHADMAKPERMLRLLQGDVGAGKTIVALLALARAIEAGCQGALMVPTDLLARQHYANLEPLARQAGIGLDLLTGREKGKARDAVLGRLASDETGILVGTHALFQQGVEFGDLALVVIDEQHRFGVHQRLALQAKAGDATDLLVMTATPIPRTLSLTLYGDMDVSRLTEKPAGRQPIDTRVLPLQRLGEVVDGIERAIAAGQRAYWVCPLVEDSELVDLAAAEDRFAALNARLAGHVGLVHGRMKGPEKDAVSTLR